MNDTGLSRRLFLLSSITGLAGRYIWLESPAQAAKKGKGRAMTGSGPQPLARQDWPPAIVPEQIGIDRGYCVFTDEFGRLAVVDMRKPADAKNPPHVVAELSGLGMKVLDFKVVPGRGYGLVLRSNESGDSQPALICVNLTPATDPALAGSIALDRFAEVSCLAAGLDYVCVAGTTPSGENAVCIYSVAKHWPLNTTLMSTWSAKGPIVDMALEDRTLAVLEQEHFEYVSLVDPRTAQSLGDIPLEGEYKSMARFKNAVLVSGTTSGDPMNNGSGRCIAKSILLGSTPHVVSSLSLDPLTAVLDSCAQRDRFMVLGDSGNDRYVISLPFSKAGQVLRQQSSTLPADRAAAYTPRGTIAASAKTAFVALGWSGIQVMSNVGDTLAAGYRYSIPRLPASGVASWGDRVVIAGGDLKLYDISTPSNPSLMSTAPLGATLRCMVGAGSFIICLTKDAVNLRKMESLDTIAATCSVQGQQVCYDKVEQRAFVLRDLTKTSTITKLKVYSNDLSAETKFEVPGSWLRGSALSGNIALCGLNDIDLYLLADKATLTGSRHFENLAIRDIALLDQCIVASAVDQNQKGFLLVISRDQRDLHVLGSIDLPHDGAALAAEKNHVVVVGRSTAGKDTATIVDITNTSTPKVVAGFEAVEAASAVTIKDKVAIVAGRGIEILSLG